jgi:glycosyltransferase involved in cell wall biosynthesis
VSSLTIGKIGQSVLDMPKLKVVRVVTASYVVPWHLANTLRRMPGDFEVTVVGQGVSSNKDAYPAIKWVDIDLDRKISVIADLNSLWSLCRFFIIHKPDIVHSIMPKAGLLSALAGFICRVPIRIHTFTGQIWVNKNPAARFFLYVLDRSINALNTVCLTDSPTQSRFLHQHNISNHGEPLPVLGKGSLSGVEISRFDYPGQIARSEQLRAELGIRKQDFVFAFVARKSCDKGAIDMVMAFSRVVNSHPEARLLFVGPDESGGELLALKITTPALFKNVIDIGRVHNHELYLSISNVLCLPSYREGFGSIVIDAGAAGVPTIGSNIVGLIDSIEDGKTGILFPAGDMDKLVQAMLSMMENQQYCKEMGVAARRRVETYFMADKMYASLKDFYLSLLATQGGK